MNYTIKRKEKLELIDNLIKINLKLKPLETDATLRSSIIKLINRNLSILDNLKRED